MTKATRRQYRWEGKRLPSVTTILDEANKPALLPWAAGCGARALARMLADGVSMDDALDRVRIEWQRERKAAADAGTRAHELLEAWAKDEPADADLDDDGDREAHRLYRAGVAHLQATSSTVLASEVALVGQHPTTGMAYGGTFDLIVERAGRLWLADWKTGARVYGDSVVPQLAAYHMLWCWLDQGWGKFAGDEAPQIRGRSEDIAGALVLHLPYEGPITEHAVTTDQLQDGWLWFEHCYALRGLKPLLALAATTETEKTDD